MANEIHPAFYNPSTRPAMSPSFLQDTARGGGQSKTVAADNELCQLFAFDRNEMQGITAFGSVLCQFDLTIYASFKGFEIPAEQVKAFFDVWHYFKEGSGN
jgi:hypothetical protein